MRRFSQRSALVTLSEINITPLLDLAFVLLIIFVITTPLLENSMSLKLPPGGGPTAKVSPQDVRLVEIGPDGIYRLGGKPASLDLIETTLNETFQANPNLVVRVRADENGRVKDTYAVLDRCLKHGITRIDLKTQPPKRP